MDFQDKIRNYFLILILSWLSVGCAVPGDFIIKPASVDDQRVLEIHFKVNDFDPEKDSHEVLSLNYSFVQKEDYLNIQCIDFILDEKLRHCEFSCSTETYIEWDKVSGSLTCPEDSLVNLNPGESLLLGKVIARVNTGLVTEKTKKYHIDGTGLDEDSIENALETAKENIKEFNSHELRFSSSTMLRKNKFSSFKDYFFFHITNFASEPFTVITKDGEDGDPVQYTVAEPYDGFSYTVKDIVRISAIGDSISSAAFAEVTEEDAFAIAMDILSVQDKLLEGTPLTDEEVLLGPFAGTQVDHPMNYETSSWLTGEFEGSLNLGQRIVEVYQEETGRMPASIVDNLGVVGLSATYEIQDPQQTKTFSLKSQVLEAIELKPDLVYLQIGANDLCNGDIENEGEFLSNFKNEIDNALSALVNAEVSPQAIVINSIPDLTQVINKGGNSLVCKMARSVLCPNWNKREIGEAVIRFGTPDNYEITFDGEPTFKLPISERLITTRLKQMSSIISDYQEDSRFDYKVISANHISYENDILVPGYYEDGYLYLNKDNGEASSFDFLYWINIDNEGFSTSLAPDPEVADKTSPDCFHPNKAGQSHLAQKWWEENYESVAAVAGEF